MNNDIVASKIIGIQFSMLSPDEIRRMSVVEVNSTENYVNNKPAIGGLFDPRMGVLEPRLICPTDHHNYIDTPGYFGHIELARPVYYIQHIKQIMKILRCICFKCSSLLINKEKYSYVLDIEPSKRSDIIFSIASSTRICGTENKNGCGCVQPKTITKPRFDTIIATWDKLKDEDEQPVIKITADIALNILKRITNEDITFMGFSPKFSRPEWMICQVLAVPPPAVRPSVKHDTQQRSEDDLTHILMNILKTNNKLTNLIQQNQVSGKILDDWTEVLQYHVATLVNNNTPNMAPISQRSGRTFKSLVERLNGKTGRVRGNLMGKRVDFSARSVISPDPNLTMKELGVPLKIAKNITYPVVVNERNQSFLKKLVLNGPDVYPGAKILEKSSGDSISLKYVDRETITIEHGDIIHRHILDGDPVLFNRQPTLHRMSMLCFYARVLDEGDTFRMNLACTAAFNADFDGDEMNMHMPQDEEARVELKHLALTSKHIISPANNSAIMSLFQDSLLGAHLITRPHIKFNTRELMNIIGRFYHKYQPELLKNPDILRTSFDVLSQIIPPLTMKMGNGNYNGDGTQHFVNIVRGEFKHGQIDKKILKSNSKGLIQRIVNDYGHEAGSKFIDHIQYIITEYMKQIGFSVGISDLIADPKTNKKITQSIQRKVEDVKEVIQKVLFNSFENKTGKTAQEKFENDVNSILNKAREDAGNIGRKSLSQDNRFVVMVNAGSKGSNINIAQMISCLGQQNVDGKRIPYGFDYRTLPHFTKYDDTPQARGFVKSSFLQGLNPQEMFFHAMGGRVGLIDTAVKSVSWDTEIYVLDQTNTIRKFCIGYWIDKIMREQKNKIQYYKEQNDMEYLEFQDYVYSIPTMDAYGNMLWGTITAITRHDPTDNVYKIETESGRSVIVADSESLLIWNPKQKEFEKQLTSSIHVGDCVPIQIYVPEPLHCIEYFMINNHYSIKLDYNNGIFLGLFITPYVSLCNHKIVFHYKDKHIRNFIYRWIKYNQIPLDYTYDDDLIIIHTYLKNLIQIKNKIPNELLQSSNECIQGFLNGLISGWKYNDNHQNFEFKSWSKHFIEDLNMLFNRIGVGCKFKYVQSMYKLIVPITNHSFFNKEFINQDTQTFIKQHCILNETFKIQQDVFLDPIINIYKVNKDKHNKLYDLTVPETYNFGLANGLQVRDTSQTGYIQRRLIKSLEDLKVEYDMTIRNNKGKIIQFNYGDDSFDSMCIEQQPLPSISYNQEELMNYYFVKEKNELVRVLFDSQTFSKLNIPLFNSKIESVYQFNKLHKHYLIENVLKQEDTTNIKCAVNIKRLIDNIKEQLYITPISLVNITFNEVYDLVEDTWKQIQSLYYIQENQLFKILYWYYLSPKELLFKHRFNRQGIITLLQTIKLQYKKSIIQPGEMVGMVAAQSIGEPTTQLTLNTFHHSGISSKSNATRGVPRIEELLSLTENQKSISTSVYLKKEHQHDKQKAQQIGYLLEYTKLKDIIHKISIIFEPNPEQESLIKEDQVMIQQFKEFEQMIQETDAIETSSDKEKIQSHWIIRIQLSKEKLLDKNISVDDIHYAIKHVYNDSIDCVFSDMNSNNIVLRLIIQGNDLFNAPITKHKENTPIDITDKLYILKNIQYNLIENLALKGVKNIQSVNLRQVKNQLILNDEQHVYENKDFWVLDTEGTNLIGILAMDEIDSTRCYSNSVIEMFDVLGIEAARQSIYNEFVEVLEFGGTYVNSHHLSLLVDRMTCTTKMVSAYRHGINKDDIGVLSKASFEETPEMFLKASRHAELDTMRGVSASVMCGQEGYMGTSSMRLILDIEQMKHYGNKQLEKSLNRDTIFDDIDEQQQQEEQLCSMDTIQIQGIFNKQQTMDVQEDDNEYSIDL